MIDGNDKTKASWMLIYKKKKKTSYRKLELIEKMYI